MKPTDSLRYTRAKLDTLARWVRELQRPRRSTQRTKNVRLALALCDELNVYIYDCANSIRTHLLPNGRYKHQGDPILTFPLPDFMHMEDWDSPDWLKAEFSQLSYAIELAQCLEGRPPRARARKLSRDLIQTLDGIMVGLHEYKNGLAADTFGVQGIQVSKLPVHEPLLPKD